MHDIQSFYDPLARSLKEHGFGYVLSPEVNGVSNLTILVGDNDDTKLCVRFFMFDAQLPKDYTSATIVLTPSLSHLQKMHIQRVVLPAISSQDHLFIGFNFGVPPPTLAFMWYYKLVLGQQQQGTKAKCTILQPMNEKEVQDVLSIISIYETREQHDRLLNTAASALERILYEDNKVEFIERALARAKKHKRKNLEAFLLNMLINAKRIMGALEEKTEEILVNVKLVDLNLSQIPEPDAVNTEASI